jgi:predicted MPP superfamily phosphohydrolase
VLLYMMKAFEWLLRVTGRYRQGTQNAERLEVRELELTFAQLPPAFEGLTIMHLSDLHLDGMPGLPERVSAMVRGHEVDLAVLTGDYRTELHGPIRATIEGLEVIARAIRAREGIVGILGNHDDCHMVAPMEAMGIRMLINERLVLERGGQRLQVIGTDDVHYYYTDQALHALEHAADAFTIALVHSPELFDVAEKLGVALYLCGHTHGGQVCLPGGTPLIKHLSRGHAYYRGAWRHGAMQGITSSGVGTSGIPVRFNTVAEILVLRLHGSVNESSTLAPSKSSSGTGKAALDLE